MHPYAAPGPCRGVRRGGLPLAIRYSPRLTLPVLTKKGRCGTRHTTKAAQTVLAQKIPFSLRSSALAKGIKRQPHSLRSLQHCAFGAAKNIYATHHA